MKTFKKIFTFILFFGGSGVALHAQDSVVNRNVNVEREYRPVIQDVGKINSIPNVLEPNIEKTAPKYTDFNLPLSVGYNVYTLPSALPTSNKTKKTKNGLAQFGLGNPLNTIADIAYPIITETDSRLDFTLNHFGTFEKRTHSVTKTAVTYDENFNKLDFYSGIGANHEFLKYYGNNFNNEGKITKLNTLENTYASPVFIEKSRIGTDTSLRNLNLMAQHNDSLNTFWRLNAFVGIKSIPTAQELKYKADISYKLLNIGSGITEHQILSSGKFSVPSGENRFGLDFEMANLLYQSKNAGLLNFPHPYSILTINPYYGIERENWNVRLGIRSSLSVSNGPGFSPSADILGEWKILLKYVSFYGGITGAYRINSMNTILEENPYIMPDIKVKDTYTPFDIFAGVKLKPLYNLLIDGYVDYKKINNAYFFVNKVYSSSLTTSDSVLYTNRFDVMYNDASLLKMGIRANYNLKNWLNIQMKGCYNSWQVSNQTHAWNKPKWEADMSTEIRITNEIFFNASAYYEAGRTAKLGNMILPMNNKIDINLGCNYAFNSSVSAFLKINNLLGNRNQYFYGYEVQGLNVLIGAALSF